MCVPMATPEADHLSQRGVSRLSLPLVTRPSGAAVGHHPAAWPRHDRTVAMHRHEEVDRCAEFVRDCGRAIRDPWPDRSGKSDGASAI
jgi:hypothetical protein